jgi:3-deoxy-7-phosphoheptulonate synthase
MVIVMSGNATEDQIEKVIASLTQKGYDAHRSTGTTRTVIGVVGVSKAPLDPREFEIMPGVHEVVKITEPYKLAGRTFQPEDTVIRIGGVEIGGRDLVMIAGPCAVESEKQLDIIASSVKRYGARILRGGAFKPRTSPYTFQGLGEEGLRHLRRVADRLGLLVITEVMDTSQVGMVAEHADILQVGARNMQNFNLLKELGKQRKAVMLKRGLSATIQEWLLSAEYIMAGGNRDVMLCERGIRTFENMTRNTMDISAIPIIKKISHLPILADPSHGTGLRDKVIPMARAAAAAGADGIMVEVHHEPEAALSDGPQSIYPEQFAELMAQLRIIAPAIGRTIGPA